MELIRVYPKGNPYAEETRVRKNINPHVILSYEETLGDSNRTTIITPQEVFMVDGDYDSITKKINHAKIIDADGGPSY